MVRRGEFSQSQGSTIKAANLEPSGISYLKYGLPGVRTGCNSWWGRSYWMEAGAQGQVSKRLAKV